MSTGDDEESADVHAIVDRLRGLLEALDSPYLADLRWMNGSPYLHVAGCPNHRGTHGDEILALFAKVGEIAAGSYGIRYTSDGEDPERQNEFRVFRLARGQLSEHPDSLLSPRFPTIEDE